MDRIPAVANRAVRDLTEWWESQGTPCHRTLHLILLAICAVVIFSTALVQLLVVCFTIAVIGCWLIADTRAIRWTPLHTAFAVFLVARIVSIPFSQFPALSVRALYIEYFFYLLFFFVAQTASKDPLASLRAITRVLIWASSLAAIVGVVMILLDISYRAQSTTAGPYTLGGFLCIVLPLALFYLKPGSYRRPMIGWMNVFLICTGIVLTLDRIHWAGMMVILVIAGIMSFRRLIAVSLILGTVAVVLSPLIQLRLIELFTIGEHMAGRDVLWQGALMLIDKHPFVGFGARTFQEIFPLFDRMPIKGVGSWHNDYLQVYMENGLLGLIPQAWIVASVIKNGWHSLQKTSKGDESHDAILALLLALSLTFLMGGMLDTLIGIPFRIFLAVFALLVFPVPGGKPPGYPATLVEGPRIGH